MMAADTPETSDKVTNGSNNSTTIVGEEEEEEKEKEELPSKRKLKRIAKAKANVGWKDEVQRFKDACLDDSYNFYAIRNTLIQGSKHFVPSTPNTKTLLPGSHKHLGGAFDPISGTIFGVPANGFSIMTITPNEDTGEYELGTIPLPSHIVRRQMKWLRGIVVDKYLFCIPSWSSAVLCVNLEAWREYRIDQKKKQKEEVEAADTAELDTNNSKNDDSNAKDEQGTKVFKSKNKKKSNSQDETHGIITLIPLPESHSKEMKWQWHGGALNDEKTAIYCVPSNAQHVLKINITDMTTSLIDIEYDQDTYPDFTLDCTNKFYGGIKGNDNCIYGSPYRAPGVLRIDCDSDRASIIGPNFGVGEFFWHGGINRHGKIYAHPSHANSVLVIDTTTTTTNRGGDDIPTVSELPIHRGVNDPDPTNRTYKWLGGAVGADGKIYCPSCDTSAVLKIDVYTDYVTTFGSTTLDKNKWQGGILSPKDNCIYCIPADGTKVLRIATDPNIVGENPIQLLGDLPIAKDKWQGASVGFDGSLYFIPENGYRVLKVTPPDSPPEIIDGKLPEGDVKIEMM